MMGIFSCISSSVTMSGNKVTVNGHTVEVPSGASISVENGKLYVNGVLYEDDKIKDKTINLIINGDVGSVICEGPVQCKNVTGNVVSKSYVECDNIGGNVQSGSYVECDTIDGDVDAGGYVESKIIKGSVEACGYVEYKGR